MLPCSVISESAHVQLLGAAHVRLRHLVAVEVAERRVVVQRLANRIGFLLPRTTLRTAKSGSL
jgi:hypothetical protein